MLILVQSVCKGSQQTMPAGNELKFLHQQKNNKADYILNQLAPKKAQTKSKF